MESSKSYCRICGAFCAIKVDVQDNRVIRVSGDKDDPETEGFTCVKGRQIPFQMYESGRLPAPQVRQSDGQFKAANYADTVKIIADKLNTIIQRHGPRSVAVYCGTQGYFNSAFIPTARAWLDAIGSPNYYSSMTIDCPAQFTAIARTGLWAAGHHSFRSADAVLMAGRNPMVSLQHSTLGGLPGSNPGQRLKEAKKRGMKLICVDPWKSDLARRADIHLQLNPGEDATLFAGLLQVIFSEGLYDKTFCDRWVEGLPRLQEAVAAFTPERVARQTGVEASLLIEAARVFASGPRGCASGGLGTEMSPHAELTHYLITILNIVCGRFNREGDTVETEGVLLPSTPRFEGAVASELLPPIFRFGQGVQPRVRGLKSISGEMPTNGLSDEILTPGDGQIRALICVGGNPALSFPDTAKTVAAMRDLELLVCLDPFMSATAELADYVVPTCLPLERDDINTLSDYGYEQPYAHYAKAVVEPPAETVEEHQFMLDLAQHLQIPLSINDQAVTAEHRASKYQLLDLITRGSRVSLTTVAQSDGGGVFDSDNQATVQGPVDGLSGQFQVHSEDLYLQLSALAQQLVTPPPQEKEYPFRLIGRRLREVMNSVGQQFPVA